MAEEVKVLGSWACPFTHQVELALRLNGIPYEHIEEDLYKKCPPLILNSNPIIIPMYKKDVPVLVHNGKPIADSLVILQYIEDAWGRYTLLPKDLQERAYTCLLAKFLLEKFIPNFRTACWCEGDEQKKCIVQTKENLHVLEREIKGKRFFGGSCIGLVDVAASYVAFWTRVIEVVNGVRLINEEEHPNLLKWSEEFMRDDVVKGSLPDRERLKASYVTVKQALLAKKAAS